MIEKSKNRRFNPSADVMIKTVTLMVFLIMVMPMVPAQVLDDLSFKGPLTSTHQGLAGSSGPGRTLISPMAADYPSVVNTSSSAWSTFSNSQRKVVRTDNGTLHAVYDSDGEAWYAQSWDNGKTWVNNTNLTNTNRFCYGTSIATNGTNIYIAYVDNNDLRFRRSLDGGITWDPDLTNNGRQIYDGDPWGAEDADYPSVTAYGQWVYIAHGTRLVWWDDSDIRVHRSWASGQGGTWATSMVTNGGPDDYAPSIVASATSVYITFNQQTGGGGNDLEIMNARSDNYAANWGTYRQLTNNNADDQNPSIDVYNNNVSVAWETDLSGAWEIGFVNSTDSGANWGTISNVSNSSSDSRYPSVVRKDEASYVIWEDMTDHNSADVFFASISNNTWSTPFDLTDSSSANVRPNAMVNITNNKLEYLYAENGPDPNNVIYNWYFVGPNNAPTLSYTGENGYASDGLDPQGNTTGHTYTYRIDYTDSDNDAPMNGYPQVLIDRNRDGDYDDANEVYTMSESNAGDTTYTDGKRYTFSTTFSDLGTYTYRFRARDDNNWRATGAPIKDHTGPIITDFNVPPTLDWLEIIGYESDGADPDAGMAGDDFVFMIEYTDILDDPPGSGFPKVMFDLDSNGQFNDTADEEAVMMEVSASDTSFRNGKVFTYTRTLPIGTDLGYKFYTEDSIGLSAETEPRTISEVKPNTQIPWLNFTGEPGYETDGANPDTGSTSTVFDFRIQYLDADNEAPLGDEVYVGIDTDFNGTIESGEWAVMDEVDTGDTTYDDGKLYTYSTTFASIDVYNYTFSAMDIKNAKARGDGIGSMSVNVNSDNTPPVLRFTGLDNYTTDGLNPEVGVANLTEFVFEVKYEDANDDAPMNGYPMVGIDMDQNGTFETNEYFTMDEISANDTIFSDGKVYRFTHIFDALGDYQYTFKAMDAIDMATGLPTGVLDGPSITSEYIESSPPVLEWTGAIGYEADGVEPNTGTTTTDFEFMIEYIDLDNDMPGPQGPKLLVDLDMDGTFDSAGDVSYGMIEVDNSTDVTTGKLYSFSQSFATKGVFNYSFEVASDRAQESGFDAGTLTGTFTIARDNSAPTLDWVGSGGFTSDGVDPDNGEPGTKFLYKVIYTDPDNDPPEGGNPMIHIDLNGNGAFEAIEVLPMVASDIADLDYTDGKGYQYIDVSFSAEGTFKYMFSATDDVGAPATDLEGTGPIVKIPIVNDPPKLVFPSGTNYDFDGLDPMKGKKDTVFTFKVTYIDVDGDEPANGYPELLIDRNRDGDYEDGEEHVAMEAEGLGADVKTGRTYVVTLTLDPFDEKESPYTYAFFVNNEINQTARLGDFEGPVVFKFTTHATPASNEALGDLFWILLVIIAAVVCLIIGFASGRSKSKYSDVLEDSEPRHRESSIPSEVGPEPYEPPADPESAEGPAEGPPADPEPAEGPAEGPPADPEPAKGPAEGPPADPEPAKGPAEGPPKEDDAV